MNIVVGDFVTLHSRPGLEFMVLRLEGEQLVVRQWPIADAPPAFPVGLADIATTRSARG